MKRTFDWILQRPLIAGILSFLVVVTLLSVFITQNRDDTFRKVSLGDETTAPAPASDNGAFPTPDLQQDATLTTTTDASGATPTQSSETAAPPPANPGAADRRIDAILAAPKANLSTFQTQTEFRELARNGTGGFHFQSPSGNIQCTIYDTASMPLRCYMKTFPGTPPPRAGGCAENPEAEWVPNYIAVSGGGITRGECAGDPRHELSNNATLPVGQTLLLDAYACKTESDTAVSCANTQNRRGFVLTSSSADVF